MSILFSHDWRMIQYDSVIVFLLQEFTATHNYFLYPDWIQSIPLPIIITYHRYFVSFILYVYFILFNSSFIILYATCGILYIQFLVVFLAQLQRFRKVSSPFVVPPRGKVTRCDMSMCCAVIVRKYPFRCSKSKAHRIC